MHVLGGAGGQLGDIPAAFLSAGQKRRLGLARVLLADRPIWLLDEPTVSLDSAAQGMLVAAVDAHIAAAETELGLILKESGFNLVDDKSPEKAEVEITGDAFSAFGMRKGNLISCKARVELKARSVADGKILAVDRETSVAVDTTEQTAAKIALQNAAGELTSRIAQKLIANAK